MPPQDQHTNQQPAATSPEKLIPTTIDHGPACGERVDCPRCGPEAIPGYHAAERQERTGGTFILCHRCGGRWRVAG